MDIEEKKKKFLKKVKELNDLSVALHYKIYQGTTTKSEIEESESHTVDFGLKILRGNEIFTVTDWGNVWNFIETAIKQTREEAVNRIDLAVEAWMEVHEEKQKSFQTKKFIEFLRNEVRK
jgi:hypothetical protein